MMNERWKPLAGVRFDRYHQDYENRLASTVQTQSHSAATPPWGDNPSTTAPRVRRPGARSAPTPAPTRAAVRSTRKRAKPF